MSVVRAILGVVVGFALAFALVIAVELFSAVVHPMPADFDGSMEQMCQHVARYPHWILAVVVVLWSAIGFVGAWVARRIGGRTAGATLIAILLLAIGWNIAMLPYTIWFKIVMPLCFAAACYFGGWGRPPLPAPTAPFPNSAT